MRFAIFNQKGGVGKTSITCNLAATLATLGKKTLIVDLDPQANSSQYILGTDYDPSQKNMADFFSSTLSFKLFKGSFSEIVQETSYDNLFIAPSSPELSEIQTKLESRYKILKLKQAIEVVQSFSNYDFIFYDTPPALNFYSLSALIAAQKVLIPFDCDSFSATAIDRVIATIEEIHEDHNPQLDLGGIIVNHFQSNAKLPQAAVKAIQDKKLPILSPYLCSSVIMRESHAHSKPLCHLKKDHKLQKEFFKLAKSIIGLSKRGCAENSKEQAPLDHA